MIAVAIATQIPMSEWEAAGPRAIETALEVLGEAEKKAKEKAQAVAERTD